VIPLDASSWAEVAIMASAVFVLAFVSGITTALAGLRQSHSRRRVTADPDTLLKLEARIGSYRSAMVILRSAAIVGIVSSSVLLAGDLSDRRWWAFVLSGVGCFFLVGLVELPIRTLVSQDPVYVLRVAAVPMASIHVLLRPLVRLAPWSAEAAVAPDLTDRADDTGILEEVRQLQELAAKPAAEDGLHEDEERMIRSIVGLKHTLVKELMVPRPDVIALATDVMLQDAIATVLDTGYGRYPVYEASLDKIVGVVYARDVLRAGTERPSNFNIRVLAREPYFVPETKKAHDLLREFLTEKIKFAVVVDEHGGVEGVIALQDLLEEIVGEIEQEFSPEEAPIMTVNPHEAVVEGYVSIDEVNETLKTRLGNEDFETVGGFVQYHLGHIPKPGERFDAEGVRVEVLTTLGRRVKRVRLTKLVRDEEAEAAQASRG